MPPTGSINKKGGLRSGGEEEISSTGKLMKRKPSLKAKMSGNDSEFQDETDVDYSDYYPPSQPSSPITSRPSNPGPPSTYSGPQSPTQSQASASPFVQRSVNAMTKLKALHTSATANGNGKGKDEWKRATRHRSGVTVWIAKHGVGGTVLLTDLPPPSNASNFSSTNSGGSGAKASPPVFRGEGIIKGFRPEEVFGVVGRRDLWDEWYASGNLVENLDESTSLTYMCMKGITGSSTRDLSLVERVELSPDGSIFFCSTSVTHPGIPSVSGRVRAQIELNGWVMEPYPTPSGGNGHGLPPGLASSPNQKSADIAGIEGRKTGGAAGLEGGMTGTKLSYYLQVNVKTFVPNVITTRYMARRPVCVARVEEYLRKHGPLELPEVEGDLGADGFEEGPYYDEDEGEQGDGELARAQRSGGGMDERYGYDDTVQEGTVGKRHLSSGSSSGRKTKSSRGKIPEMMIGSDGDMTSGTETESKKRSSKKHSIKQKHGKISEVEEEEEDEEGRMAESAFESEVARTSNAITSAGGTVPSGTYYIPQPSTITPSSSPLLSQSLTSFRKALASFSSQDWAQAVDHKGAKIWMKQGENRNALPTVRGEAGNLAGVTTEQVLGTLLSKAAREVWDDRWGYTKLVKTENGLESGSFFETTKGIHPHLEPRAYHLTRGVEREDPSSGNSEIVLLSRSQPHDVSRQVPSGHVEAFLDFSGFVISPSPAPHPSKNTHQHIPTVNLTHVIKTDIMNDKLEPFLFKIAVAVMAKGPRQVKEVIDDYGFAPWFVRWEEGKVRLVDDGGDITEGKVWFEIEEGKKKHGHGQSKGDQKAWFQWSDKMYERGLSIEIEPRSAAVVSKLDGFERTLEFAWKSDFGGKAKIMVSKSDYGESAEDVWVSGNKVVETVVAPIPESGRAKKRKSKKHHKKEKKTTTIEPIRPILEKETLPVEQKSASDAEQGSSRTELSNTVGSVVQNSRSIPGKFSNLATKSPSALPGNVAATPTTKPPNGGKVAVATNKDIPEDAMLIISKDLYFTRQQVLMLFLAMAGAFLMGKVL